MTESHTTLPEAANQVAEAEAPETEAPETDKAGREAARYRRQLREAEAERDAARGAAEAAQRALVEHLAQTTGRVRPVALWASGVALADLLDEEGNVDAAKVSEAAENAASTLGLSRTPKPDPSQGWHDWSAPGEDDFSRAFGPRH